MKVYVYENEHIDGALSRLKKKVEKSGLMKELRSREFYEKPTSERKRKKTAAINRWKRELKKQQLPKKMF